MSINKLKKLHPHKRDLRIEFDSKNHTYSVDGNDNYISATELVYKFFPVFEKDFWADKQSKKTGIPKEEIIKAANSLQKKIHPDVNPNSNTERLSQIINEAKETVLKNDFS